MEVRTFKVVVNDNTMDFLDVDDIKEGVLWKLESGVTYLRLKIL